MDQTSEVSALLLAVEASAELKTRLARVVGAALVALDGDAQDRIASRIRAKTRSGKESTARQRLRDLKNGNNAEVAANWLADVPDRLVEILVELKLEASVLKSRMEAMSANFHPAWSTLPADESLLVDSVPGLAGGIKELEDRTCALQPGAALIISGEPGAGASTLLRRLAKRGAGKLVGDDEEWPPKSTALVDSVSERIEHLVARARTGSVALVLGVSRAKRADVILGPWRDREIASLARILGDTPEGKPLAEVPGSFWTRVAWATTWTPRSVGYLLEAIAQGKEAPSPKKLADVLVGAVARAHHGTLDAAILRDAFTEIIRATFDSSLPGRWPSQLSEKQLRAALDRTVSGASPLLLGPVARAAALADLERARADSKGAGLAPIRNWLTRFELAIRPPEQAHLVSEMVSAGLVERTDAGTRPSANLAAVATAPLIGWDALVKRLGDPSLHPVLLAAVPLLDDPKLVMAALLDSGSARQLVDLRIALAIVARAPVTVSEDRAREVIGSVAALIEAGCDDWFPIHAAMEDLWAAGERYSEQIRSGDLPPLDSVARWLEMTKASRASHPAPPREMLLPWQHIDALLNPEATLSLPEEILQRLLQVAIARGDNRARAIATGVAKDPRARRLGATFPKNERLDLISRMPPTKWNEHWEALVVCLGNGRGAASEDAAARAFDVLICRSQSEDQLQPPIYFLSSLWIDALRRAGKRQAIEFAWRKSLQALEDELAQDSPVGTGERCFPLAMSLAEFGDLEALRALARLGDERLLPRVYGLPTPTSSRWQISARATRLLIERREGTGLRDLAQAGGDHGTIRSTIDAACREELEIAIWFARELRDARAIHIVFEQSRAPRCLDLIRAWSADADHPSHPRAVHRLTTLREAQDARVVSRYIERNRPPLHLISEALQHPAKEVQEAAVRWLRLNLESLSPEELSELPRVANSIAEAVTKSGRSGTSPLLEQLGSCLSGWHLERVFELLTPIDPAAADRVLARIEGQNGARASELANAWFQSSGSDLPRRAQKLVAEPLLAQREAEEMPIERLSEFVRELDDESWLGDHSPRIRERQLARFPRVALQTLFSKDPNSFATEFSRRSESLAQRDPARVAEFVTWLAAADSRAALALIELLLKSSTPTDPGRERKKRKGASS